MPKLWLLPSVALAERERLPDKPGVYFAISGREIVYIGMAGKQGLRRRWGDNSGYGAHDKLAELQWLNRESKVRLVYWVRPLWRVSHDEATQILKFYKKHDRLPSLNKKFEPRVWWIDAIDYLGDCWIYGCVMLAMYIAWRMLT
jgi:hypothetical protein